MVFFLRYKYSNDDVTTGRAVRVSDLRISMLNTYITGDRKKDSVSGKILLTPPNLFQVIPSAALEA